MTFIQNGFSGVRVVLQAINDNWGTIIIIIGLLLLLAEKIKKYVALSKEQKIEIALDSVKHEMLKLMSDAEIQWKDYKKSGQIKKSQVIKEIYADFPELKKYMSEDELIKKIEKIIDDNMDELNIVINNMDPKEIAKKNTSEEESSDEEKPTSKEESSNSSTPEVSSENK